MNKKFRSISWTIWHSMIRSIFLFIIVVIIINITVVTKVNDDFVFDQLQEVAQVKRFNDESNPVTEKRDSLWAAHFIIDSSNDTPVIQADKYTSSRYLSDDQSKEIIHEIVDLILVENNTSGKLIDSGISHYFYVDKFKSDDVVMVFITSMKRKTPFKLEHLSLVVFLSFISFFISRITAKKIAKPIQELELFSEEISKRNWHAKVPLISPNEIGLLAHSLENMRDSLKIAEERDHEFLQSTSHDLKTPVMIIKGYAQAIIDGLYIDSEASAAEVILMESNRLEHRIKQLLRLNTFSHALEYTENRVVIRIDRILKNLISKFKVIHPELTLEDSLIQLEVIGDPEALYIAFENILDNQTRYAKSTIKIVMNPRGEITISNDGPPFDIDPLIIFDTYKKDKEGKFGLGLAIVKQVILSHEGQVTANNTDVGVEFKIELQEL